MIRVTFVPRGSEAAGKQVRYPADGVFIDDGWLQLRQPDGKTIVMIPQEQIRSLEFMPNDN